MYIYIVKQTNMTRTSSYLRKEIFKKGAGPKRVRSYKTKQKSSTMYKKRKKKDNLYWANRPLKSSKSASRKRKPKKTNSWNTYIKSTCAPGYKKSKAAGSL